MTKLLRSFLGSVTVCMLAVAGLSFFGVVSAEIVPAPAPACSVTFENGADVCNHHTFACGVFTLDTCKWHDDGIWLPRHVCRCP